MTRTISDKPTDALIAKLVEYDELRGLALRRNDIPAANRHFDRATPILKELASRNPEGRDALEGLLAHASPFVRLDAAFRVLAWAPASAIPVLARLALNPGSNYSHEERGSVITSAKEILYHHFGIRSFDPNALIEPLRAFGVDWPRRESSLD